MNINMWKFTFTSVDFCNVKLNGTEKQNPLPASMIGIGDTTHDTRREPFIPFELTIA